MLRNCGSLFFSKAQNPSKSCSAVSHCKPDKIAKLTKRSSLSCSPSRFSPFISPEESVESDDEDNLSRVMRHRATIPWRSCGTYLSSAGLLLLLLLLLSQLLKHSLMVAIDYWLAHWTSKVITAKIEAASRNCSLVQVRDADNTGELRCLTVFVVPVYTLCKVGGDDVMQWLRCSKRCRACCQAVGIFKVVARVFLLVTRSFFSHISVFYAWEVLYTYELQDKVLSAKHEPFTLLIDILDQEASCGWLSLWQAR